MSDQKEFLCSHLVTLEWPGRATGANLEKIHSTGATLDAEDYIDPATILTISSPEFQIAATVTTCVRDEAGVLIEVAFAGGETWTPERFRPRHLTDPDIVLVRSLLRHLK